MGRSVEAKRHQRKLQKKRKILKRLQQSQCSADDVSSDPKTKSTNNQDVGTSPSDAIPASRSDIEKLHINELITKFCGGRQGITLNSDRVTQKEYEKLQSEFYQANRDMRYYRNKAKEEEKRADAVEKECQRGIVSVRSFWRDKIYREGCRSGKILTISMQNKQLNS